MKIRLQRMSVVPYSVAMAWGKIEIQDVTSSVSYEKSAPVPGGLTMLFVRGLQNIEGTSWTATRLDWS